MSIYNLTYSKLGQQLLPPDKRNTKLVAFVTCLLAPMQWLCNLWLNDYRTGSVASQWSAGTYAKYARVIYKKVVYESMVDSNYDMPPSAKWIQVQADFIGLSERLLYNGQILNLTWAMNKWFGTTFRQRDIKGITQVARASNIATITITNHGYSTNQMVFIENLSNTSFNGTYSIAVVDANTITYANTGSNFASASDNGQAYALSDIYINNNVVSIPVFIVGQSENNSSDSFSTTSSEFVVTDYSLNQINFNINVPATIYNGLDMAMVNNDSIFRSFVDVYLPAGITYYIQKY